MSSKAPSEAAQPAGQFCVVTGLPLQDVPKHLLAGPCSQLTGVLYCGRVQKAVQKWSYWHSRNVLLTWNRLVIVDDEAQVRRFHYIEQVKGVKVTRLPGSPTVRLALQLSPGPGVMLEFPDQESYRQFIYVLQSIHAALSLHVSDSVDAQASISMCSTSMSSRHSAAESEEMKHSKVSKLRTHLRRMSVNTPPIPPQQIETEMDRDRREFESLVHERLCPVTGLPLCLANAPNLKVLFACEQITALQGDTRMGLLVTHDKLVLYDVHTEALEQYEATSDVRSVLFCSGDDSVMCRVDLGGRSKDMAIRFTEGKHADQLLHVLRTIREGSQWNGVSLVDASVVRSVSTPAHYERPPVTLSFVTGTPSRQMSTTTEELPSDEITRLDADNAIEPDVTDFSGAERIREWELQQHGSLLRRRASDGDAYESSNGVTVPCDPSECSTCESLTRQLSSPSRKPSISTSLDTDKRPPTGHTTGHVSRSGSGCLSHSSSSVQTDLQAVRRKIVDLKTAQQASSDNLDSLIAKVNAHLTTAA